MVTRYMVINKIKDKVSINSARGKYHKNEREGSENERKRGKNGNKENTIVLGKPIENLFS